MSTVAVACAALIASAPQTMHLSFPARSTLRNPVSVEFQLEGDLFKAHFEVHNSQINSKAVLGPNEYPFQHDTVELFISTTTQGSGPFPYFEFELSPNDQVFEVRINDLKKPFINNIDMKIEHHVLRVVDGWEGWITVPLKNLGWQGDLSQITGDAYAITGFAPNRNYWSLWIPNQSRPNFHQPEFFRPFFTCPTAPP